MDIDKILRESDEFINSFSDKAERRILKAIRKLELSILDMTKDLPTANNSLKYNMKQAQAFHENLLSEFEKVYNVEIKSILKDFNIIEVFAAKELLETGIMTSFSKADSAMFTALKKQTESAFLHLGMLYSDKMAQAVYDKVITGSKFSDLVSEFKNILTGNGDMPGTPLASYAKTYANDSVNRYYAQIHLKKAKDAGLTEFIYYGNAMKTTRDWCRAHIGGVYSYAECKAFEKQSWKGKAPGDIFIVRGGYNCRHQFRAVNKEMVKGLK